MPNPRDVLYMKMAGRGGWAHLDLADALKVMEKKFSYCYYKMAYCALIFLCLFQTACQIFTC